MPAYQKSIQLKGKKAKKKSPKKSLLKQKAWQAFSKYVRLRDCLLTTGTLTHGRCITCGKVFEFSSLQAGHFIPGRNNAILFNPVQVHAQCIGCNMFGKGMFPEYYKEMVSRYGLQEVQQMIENARIITKITPSDLIETAQKYTTLSGKLLLISGTPDGNKELVQKQLLSGELV